MPLLKSCGKCDMPGGTLRDTPNGTLRDRTSVRPNFSIHRSSRRSHLEKGGRCDRSFLHKNFLIRPV
ncbi:hypothetical protein ACE1CD_14640 [Aerosakkonema sp. BLCC-F183]|uniref:hypothetical protein n=1 Tax=Aerosakkonema sp. BLCC-F183 TaxID=3342834 RepID=UPI0035BA6E0E